MTIVIENLTHRYGVIPALRGVSGAASPGKITALLGPNAAGKSTLLRCIIGAIKPSAGCVLVDGKPAHATPPHLMAQKLAYVPQRSTVAAAFTVREVVELGRYVLKPDPKAVSNAISQMDLIDVAERPFASLSVGQQQRVTLARALAQLGPEERERSSSGHLVLDEPMSAMDLRHVRDAMDHLRSLADRGITIIIAMHDLTLAAKVADDVWLLNEGQLRTGSACEVLDTEQLQRVYGVAFEWIDGRLLTA